MPIKWMIFFFSTWTTIAVIGAGVEQAFSSFIAGGGYTTVINQLFAANIVTDTSTAGQVLSWLTNLAWIGAIWKMYTFQFSFLTGGGFTGFLALLICFVPIGLSMVIATLFSIRGSASS